jgi:hypothetical protein
MKVSLHNRTLNRITPHGMAQALLLALGSLKGLLLYPSSFLRALCVLFLRAFCVNSFLSSPNPCYISTHPNVLLPGALRRLFKL